MNKGSNLIGTTDNQINHSWPEERCQDSIMLNSSEINELRCGRLDSGIHPAHSRKRLREKLDMKIITKTAKFDRHIKHFKECFLKKIVWKNQWNHLQTFRYCIDEAFEVFTLCSTSLICAPLVRRGAPHSCTARGENYSSIPVRSWLQSSAGCISIFWKE